MSESLTAGITIFGGFFVFVLGQIVIKFFIEPIQKQSEAIGDIAHSLIYYADQYSNPGSGKPEDIKETSNVLRKLASELVAKTYVIKLYIIWESLKLVPKRNAIMEAHSNLIGLSNIVYEKHVGMVKEAYEMRKNIERSLNIKPRLS
jgi:hypothetical protein